MDSSTASDAGLQRAGLSKLYKDYERLKVTMESLSSESQLVKVHVGGNNSENTEAFARTGNYVPNEADSSAKSNNNTGNLQKQAIVMKPLIQIQDIDELIIEEREREIKKINEDLFLVNDMFK